eukprot:CAMPEP_0183575436 /NCGR_PEP_ID=MMETSP0371-20130417/135592_1 /TAXON_ID=268820 /ORGANISM="Peridinium aciculiferum, Strain PAER-2" /LENGTH=36 /DNA_ID= /DNA_START= /DNA_END= /DNA_ORIENTATION=
MSSGVLPAAKARYQARPWQLVRGLSRATFGSRDLRC